MAIVGIALASLAVVENESDVEWANGDLKRASSVGMERGDEG